MAVFEELNQHTKRLDDPEERRAEKIVRAQPKPTKQRKGSSSVSLDTYKRTKLLINVAVGLIIVVAVVAVTVTAVRIFIG